MAKYKAGMLILTSHTGVSTPVDLFHTVMFQMWVKLDVRELNYVYVEL